MLLTRILLFVCLFRRSIVSLLNRVGRDYEASYLNGVEAPAILKFFKLASSPSLYLADHSADSSDDAIPEGTDDTDLDASEISSVSLRDNLKDVLKASNSTSSSENTTASAAANATYTSLLPRSYQSKAQPTYDFIHFFPLMTLLSKVTPYYKNTTEVYELMKSTFLPGNSTFFQKTYRIKGLRHVHRYEVWCDNFHKNNPKFRHLKKLCYNPKPTDTFPPSVMAALAAAASATAGEDANKATNKPGKFLKELIDPFDNFAEKDVRWRQDKAYYYRVLLQSYFYMDSLEFFHCTKSRKRSVEEYLRMISYFEKRGYNIRLFDEKSVSLLRELLTKKGLRK
jgi:hypothetical protein